MYPILWLLALKKYPKSTLSIFVVLVAASMANNSKEK